MSKTTSFSNSYPTSLNGSGSAAQNILAGSYIDPYAHIINPFVIVNGYGINLI